MNQQEKSNCWIDLLRLGVLKNMLSLFRHVCLTTNMGQNVGMPNLEASQYSDVYYMSLINLFLFGVKNNSRVSDVDDIAAYI